MARRNLFSVAATKQKKKNWTSISASGQGVKGITFGLPPGTIKNVTKYMKQWHL